MTNQKSIGLGVGLLGLLLVCCACPLALNALVLITSGGRNSLYGSLFSSLRLGSLSAVTYISLMQYLCIGFLALIVLVIGLVLAFQASSGRTPSIAPVEENRPGA